MSNLSFKAIEYGILDRPVQQEVEGSGNLYLSFMIQPKNDVLSSTRLYNIFFNGDDLEKQAVQLENILKAYDNGKLKSIWLADVEVPTSMVKEQLPDAENYVRLWDRTVGRFNEGDIMGQVGKDGVTKPRIFSTIAVTVRCTNANDAARGEDAVKMAARWYRRNYDNGYVIPVSEYTGEGAENIAPQNDGNDNLFDGTSGETEDDVTPPANQQQQNPPQNNPQNNRGNFNGRRM